LESYPSNRILRKIESIWGSSGAWPEFFLAMRQTFPAAEECSDPERDPLRWALLPGICCQAAGGDFRSAEEVGAAWFLFYLAAHIFDNIEDHDQPEAWWAGDGEGVALNIASGLLFSASLGLNALLSQHVTQPAAAEISAEFYRSLLVMNSGQHRDLITRTPGLKDWMDIAGAKSGAFFSLACRAGARLAIDDPPRLEGFGSFGQSLGVLIQMLDDLEDFFRLRRGLQRVFSSEITRSLPAAYARDVFPTAELEKFEIHLKAALHDPDCAQKVLNQIEASGAILYTQTEIERHQAMARAGLEAAAPAGETEEILLGLLSKLSLA
jgi:geranylgeranyl pyrophosphate synthase